MSVDVALRHRFVGFALDVRFGMAAGVTALFGPSGAGKSTILAAIAGLLHPQQGTVSLDGRVLLDTAKGVDLPPEQRHIGVMFQDGRLFPHMDVQANLLFGWRRSNRRASEKEIDAIIELLGLRPLLLRATARLSGGEKARVGLGRALLSSPSLLLLDEPLAAVDATRKAEVLPYLERLCANARLPVLYVSHATDEVLRLANHVVLINDGRLTAQGSVFDFASGALTGAQATGGVIEARVATQRADGLTELIFEGGLLLVASLPLAKDAALRVRIHAEDIMLALEAPRAISANNILPCQILAVRHTQGDRVEAELGCGGARFAARITKSSADRLGLVPGMAVYAIIKSMTIDPRTS